MTQAEQVRVGDVLRLERREVAVDPETDYRLIGVYSFGKGIFHREPQLGLDLGNYRFFHIEPDDLVLSNIQAWEGAIAHARVRDSGTIGTHRFLTYVPCDAEQIDTNWARWFFLSEPGMLLIRQAAPGTAVRNRTLAVKRFEDLVIPLPPIDEQRRVAAHLDVVAQLNSVGAGRAEASDARADGLIASWLGQRFEIHASMIPLAEIATVRRGKGPQYEAGTDALVVNQGCVQWGGIVLHRAREADRTWWETVSDEGRVAQGDVLVNSTGEGTIGRAVVATTHGVGLPYDSHVMAVRTDPEALLPEYLTLYLRSPQGQKQIAAAKGANTTKQTELGKAKLERIEVPLSSIAVQRALVDQFERFAHRHVSLRKLAERRQARLRSLLPSSLNREFATPAR